MITYFFHIFSSLDWSSVNTYTLGSLFPALAARVRGKWPAICINDTVSLLQPHQWFSIFVFRWPTAFTTSPSQIFWESKNRSRCHSSYLNISFQNHPAKVNFFHLKVVGIEKLGGLGVCILIEKGTGPWWSMPVYFLMDPSSFLQHISVSC